MSSSDSDGSASRALPDKRLADRFAFGEKPVHGGIAIPGHEPAKRRMRSSEVLRPVRLFHLSVPVYPREALLDEHLHLPLTLRFERRRETLETAGHDAGVSDQSAE